MDVALGDVPGNLAQILESFSRLAGEGASLVVFPECALTGYCFESRGEAFAHAETIPGPSVEEASARCAAANAFMVFGMLEREGDRLYNACVLIGPQGLTASYRKIHLPRLGVDHFADAGDRPFEVHDLGFLRLGMHICYDGSFPEPARCMALDGADLIVLPTNWPAPAINFAKHIVNARAMENHVYYLSANRVGLERGFSFIGESRICDPFGNTLAAAEHDKAAEISATIDPQLPRKKRLVRQPGAHEIDRLRDRRPEFYNRLLSGYTRPDPS